MPSIQVSEPKKVENTDPKPKLKTDATKPKKTASSTPKKFNPFTKVAQDKAKQAAPPPKITRKKNTSNSSIKKSASMSALEIPSVSSTRTSAPPTPNASLLTPDHICQSIANNNFEEVDPSFWFPDDMQVIGAKSKTVKEINQDRLEKEKESEKPSQEPRPSEKENKENQSPFGQEKTREKNSLDFKKSFSYSTLEALNEPKSYEKPNLKIASTGEADKKKGKKTAMPRSISMEFSEEVVFDEASLKFSSMSLPKNTPGPSRKNKKKTATTTLSFSDFS